MVLYFGVLMWKNNLRKSRNYLWFSRQHECSDSRLKSFHICIVFFCVFFGGGGNLAGGGGVLKRFRLLFASNCFRRCYSIYWNFLSQISSIAEILLVTEILFPILETFVLTISSWPKVEFRNNNHWTKLKIYCAVDSKFFEEK